MGLFGNNVVFFKGQNYDQLRKAAQSSGSPFEDPEFPAADASLFHKRTSPGKIEWKRPGELTSDPHLVVDGTKSGDVSQGQLGNCWFVAATANLAQEKELWETVVPNAKDQDWDADNKEKYAGIFHFRFWRFGKWTDVVIDDRLPTHGNKLIYTHSEEGNEFWSALLEKAYAKISGCYENLDGGNTADALVDFTGGVAEQINLADPEFQADQNKKKELHSQMKKYSERRFQMSASIKVTNAEEMEARTDVGLVKGHAYGVTAVKSVKLGSSGFFKKEKEYLVRLRNPWGEKEWNGPWSDGSPEWSNISESQRKSIGIVNEDDGEFWMPFDQFCQHFTTLVICRMPNKTYLSLHRTWHESLFISEWKYNSNSILNRAGGCINAKETFLQNPQFLICVDSDKDDIIISLTQPDTRADRSEDPKTIGFYVMEVESNRKHRAHTIKPKTFMSAYINSRSVFAKSTLLRGRYIVVPTIFEAKVESPLMIRVFSDSGAEVKELKKDHPDPGTFDCFQGGNIRVVSQVNVLSASNLKKQDHFGGGADPYVYVKCEGKTATSRVQKDTLNPEWNYNSIFYRRKPGTPIIVEVWNHNVVKDSFMGQAIFLAGNKGQPEHNVAVLKKKGRDSEDAAGGQVSVVITTTDDLMAL